MRGTALAQCIPQPSAAGHEVLDCSTITRPESGLRGVRAAYAAKFLNPNGVDCLMPRVTTLLDCNTRSGRLRAAAVALVLGAALHYAPKAPAQAIPQAAAVTKPSPAFFCTFRTSPTDCGFHVQGKESDRASIVDVGRDGWTAVRLRTEPGDSRVNGSGDWERNDLLLSPSSSYCNNGQEEWWAHSVMFPSDFVFPFAGGIVMDFHHNASRGQANFELQTMRGVGLRFRGYGGGSVNAGQYTYEIPDPYGAARGTVARNVWYDFVYHVKWSEGSDGLMEAWLNGRKVMTHRGPTLYAGISCYFKLANYHAPHGQPSSVIHDRIVRGSSAAEVALTPLQ
jgi:hypothetical protein